MKTYLVGGAVRDALLNRPVHEHDWVVVGATAEQLLARGFKPVGKDFPVFLHPETKEEYALARTERKIARGYKGFEFYADPSVTLEQDLSRRDLTINAIAQDTSGRLIDPFGGQADIHAKILRHVSPAFAEDPVRILRLGRFHARFPDFSINDETLTLMKQMVLNGEVDALVAERVWAECAKALQESSPIRFFELLSRIHALDKVFPHLQLITQNHQALLKACELSCEPAVRFACLCHTVPSEHIPELLDRTKVPRHCGDLVRLLRTHLRTYQQATLSAHETLQLIKQCDGLRRPERFAHFITAAQACTDTADHSNALKNALHKLQRCDIRPVLERGLQGKELAEAIDRLRLDCLQTEAS